MYTLCSVSKTLVSAALGILVDQGSLCWADTIGQHLPDFKPSGKVSISNTATFNDILRHSGGLDNPVVSLLGPGGKVITPQDDFMDVLNSTPTERNGETLYDSWVYSNVGYALVALVIEKISGETFAQFVRSRILMPLGMNSTAVTAAQIEDTDNLAQSYAQMQDGSWEKLEHEWTNENNTPVLAMVGIRSTVMDMLIFCAAVMDAFAPKADTDDGRISGMQQEHSRSTNFEVLSGIKYNPLKQVPAILNGCYWTRPHNDPIGHVARYHLGWMRVIMPSCMVSWGSWNMTLADNATRKEHQSARDESILGRNSGNRILYKSTGVGFCGTCSVNIFPESRSSVIAFSNGTNCGDAADFCASLLIQELFDLEPKVDILAMVRREVASREHDFESIMSDLEEHRDTSQPEGDALDYVGEYRGLGTTLVIQNAPNGDGLQLCFNHRSDMVQSLEYFAKDQYGFWPKSQDAWLKGGWLDWDYYLVGILTFVRNETVIGLTWVWERGAEPYFFRKLGIAEPENN